MADNRPDIVVDVLEPGAVPSQPEAQANKKTNLKVIGALAAVILVIGLANLRSGTKQEKISNSALSAKPASPNATQVNGFQLQQQQIQQHDIDERQRLAVLAAQTAQLQQEQGVPGPESPDAAPMTPAQRDAMYGKGNPNAPQKTSGASQAQAEAKQRQLERVHQHQQALDSGTVAIDFAQGTANAAKPKTVADSVSDDEMAEQGTGKEVAQDSPSQTSTASSHWQPDAQRPHGPVRLRRLPGSPISRV